MAGRMQWGDIESDRAGTVAIEHTFLATAGSFLDGVLVPACKNLIAVSSACAVVGGRSILLVMACKFAATDPELAMPANLAHDLRWHGCSTGVPQRAPLVNAKVYLRPNRQIFYLNGATLFAVEVNKPVIQAIVLIAGWL